MTSVIANGREFSVERDLIPISSLSRPDTRWIFVDPSGHEHRWFEQTPEGLKPASEYHPNKSLSLPTLRKIVDYEGDDESPATSHWECPHCGVIIVPGTCADTHEWYVPGLSHYRIDGTPVSKEEFERQARAAGLLRDGNGQS